MLCARIPQEADIEKSVEEFHVILKTACNKTYKTHRKSKETTMHKSVPWWTEELTTLRKRTNALRRRHQRTQNNDELRERHRIQYLQGRAQYAATRSWKEFCNFTTAANPWNEVYKIAAGKRRHYSLITSLRKRDGTMTTDMDETVKLMLDHFTPEDKVQDDSDFHKRTKANGSVYNPDDREFTMAEVRNAIESMSNKKAPGEDGITSDIFKLTYETSKIYNSNV